MSTTTTSSSCQRDPISVRTTRLNNLILCKNGANAGGVSKTGRRSLGSVASASVSPAVAEALNREGLLDAFCLLYNECDKEALKKRDKNIADFVTKFRPIVVETQKMRVNAHDFALKAVIGKGYFGNVHLAVEKQTNDVYAMKKIKKSVVTTSQVKEERDIMSRRSSQWITNLQYAFQDNDNLYLIMEFLPGGDLLGLMTRNGPFDEELARFYLAELTVAINALHQLGYVHRDIKPENILIDRFGHIKLADFGNAAALDRDGHVLSLSPVGTPDYIAPELLQTISSYKLTKSMHDVSCDYWSMGIIGYELLCEVTPFHEDNVHETYSKILSHCEESHMQEIINFPTDLKVSKEFKALILALVTNPTQRLCYEQLRKHPFFAATKWESLRTQVPPIIPHVRSDDDISNFEDSARYNSNKSKTGTFTKKSLSTNIKTTEFSGKDLPFVGYTFVHMDQANALEEEAAQAASEEARLVKLNAKIKELQSKLKQRMEEISLLQQQLLRAEQQLKQSDCQSKLLQDAKDEIIKMKNAIKEKTLELAACKTQMKTLQSSLQVEEEMWAKKEATITELLRMNRQKYEEAKHGSEQRYEKIIAEKKHELTSIVRKLDARESELTAKNEECAHLQEKMENYKEMLRQFKEKSHADKQEFEQNKMQLTDTYEQKLAEMRSTLRQEKDTKTRLTLELREVRHELDDSICSSKSNQEAKRTTDKNNDEILRRLNREIAANNELHAQNVALEQNFGVLQKQAQEFKQEIERLERDLKVAECSQQLAQSTLAAESPYETAPGSLTELRDIEEQLRNDLEAARENENLQRVRADKLQEIVEKLEEMMEKFNENTLSPTKAPPPPPQAAPRITPSVGDMLERQNEKLEDKLSAVREQMIVERQAARTAHLALWKLEKQLDETQTAKKMIQRRMELTEERIKKVQTERDEAQRQCKEAQGETRQKEERLQELRDELAAAKRDVQREHRMWEKAEQERMKGKSEIIEHISSVHKLQQQLSELRQKQQQTHQKSEALATENGRLLRELNVEREKTTNAGDSACAAQLKMQQLSDNYERLKYACSITDNQLTEVESMLEGEQQRNAQQQQKCEQLYASVRDKDDKLAQLQQQLHEACSAQKASDGRVRHLCVELDEHKLQQQQLQKKIIAQQEQLMQQTSSLFAAQERVEVLDTECGNLQTLHENHEREIALLKEENARILCDLFHAKQQLHELQAELKESLCCSDELQAELSELQAQMAEKQQHYLQRDIKSEATLAQHKKLIDYLQLKVEDLTQRKKKTLADKLFGTHSSSGAKENISPNAVEQSILYRALQEELKREQQRCKSLQQQLETVQSTTGGVGGGVVAEVVVADKSSRHSPLKPKKPTNAVDATAAAKSPKKPSPTKAGTSNRRRTYQMHRFELALLPATADEATHCLACKNVIIAGSTCWRCRECRASAHRKCRSDVNSSCDGVGAVLATAAVNKQQKAEDNKQAEEQLEKLENDDANSLGKYSYEAQLDEEETKITTSTSSNVYAGHLICDTAQQSQLQQLSINCAYELDAEQRVLLLGCSTGLFAWHQRTQQLVHIAGIDSVNYIAICLPLAKAILVGAAGESLYQCDYRQLQTRSQATPKSPPAPLEASVLDLPFANRAAQEKWQLVKISAEAENALDTVAIAATSTRIVILKYDMKLQKFKPVRALDTATAVSAILYTRHTAIVSSDKFFEIDLDTYAAEEFVDLSDSTLSHTISCQPVVVVRISPQEFLLCFMECGIFVDEYGCRSRPYDISWQYTPTGFVYRAPFLYVSHFQSLQILRLHRSYSREIAATSTAQNDIDADTDEAAAPDTNDVVVDAHAPSFKRVFIKLYMPSLLADSSKLNCYVLSVHPDSGQQLVHHFDALQAFREQLSVSVETISSIATSITLGSLATTDSID